MDDWISELEMAWNEEANINQHENKEIERLDEELARLLGLDFSLQHSQQNNLSSSQSISDNNNHNSNNDNGNGGKRKRREGDQVREHIMAERKRRELISQRFIALSALIPSLKKADKTTILEEAIKHLQEMKEKVALLENAKASTNNKQIDGTICDPSEGDNRSADTLPKIELKVSHNKVLIRICCERRKGILGSICEEVENRKMNIVNTNVIAFQTSTLDITILAQMEAVEGDDNHGKDLVRNLYSILRLSCLS